MEEYIFLYGILFWVVISGLVYGIRPKASFHKIVVTDIGRRERFLLYGVVLITVLACILPMSVSPYYNGEIPDHRNQYEVMAESILNGHLYLDYDDVDPRLEAMDNPYDPEAREEAGVAYHWDHAWYKGHYYMYFGVVPVFLLFLPFRIITGMTLVTYKATQVFVTAAIVGIFALFYELAMVFARKLFFGMYLFMATAFSIMSIWYSIGTPALYSTAIVSAVCLEVWSLFFFVRAVWIETSDQKQIVLAFAGSILGALAFGCRPPVALANLLVIPMLFCYLRGKRVTWSLVCKLVAAAAPYFIVAVMLMLYNYLRFENPFEFGQAYQLTSADQHLYGNISTTFVWQRQISLMLFNFIDYVDLTDKFPYIFYGGVFVNFPVLLLIFIGGGQEAVLKKIKDFKVGLFFFVLTLLPVIVTFMDALWAPSLGERYRMDLYFLMGILCFLIIALWHETISEVNKRKFACMVDLFCLFTVLKCFVLFLVPNDCNWTQVYPDLLDRVQSAILFWVN